MASGFRHEARWNGRRFVVFVSRAAVIALLAIGTPLLGTAWLIRSGVHATSEAALQEQPGDRVSALMAYVELPTHTLRERNRAVWALGQLGDARALPVLEKHFTGRACDHDLGLCQYELKKAMELCRGGTNMSALLWR